MSKNPLKILVVAPSWIGDMVISQSLLKLLQDRHPHAEIDVIAPEWTRPLLELMPEVHNAIPISIAHGRLSLGVRIKIGKKLRIRQYDRAIILPRSFKSAIIPFVARARRRTGFLGELRWRLLNDIRELDRHRLPRTVDRFLALGIESGETLLKKVPNPHLLVKRESALSTLDRFGKQIKNDPILGICPGAEYGPAKRWPVKYFAQVANEKLKEGWGVWLFGSNKEVAITNEIHELTQGRSLDFGGKTSLAEAINLMSLTTAVVSNDSGMMHVASAIGCHIVGIYGSSDPDHTPPLCENKDTLYLGLSCSPCFKRECPPGHYDCLNDLKPEMVLNSLKKIRNSCAS